MLTTTRSTRVRWPSGPRQIGSPVSGLYRQPGRTLCVLSGYAVERLSELRALDGWDSRPLFPGRSGKPLSNMVCAALLLRLGIPTVAHGFRSSLKDWCIECTDTP